MNKLLKISILILLPGFLLAQGGIINDGAKIQVSSGTQVKITGAGIINQNSGQITNDGNIYLQTDFNQTTAATYTGTADSWLWFEGTGLQNATGDAPLNIAKLRVDNGNRLVLGNQVNVSNQVDLTLNGDIELGAFNLVVASGGLITGYDKNNYIITNGTGSLQREVGAVDVSFPVGNSSYNPAVLNNIGVVDNLEVRVFDQVFSQGTTGPLNATNVVNRTWMISEKNIGGSNLSMTLQWSTADELAFDRTNSGVSHHLSGNTWDYAPVYGLAASVGADWSQTRTGFTSFSPFVVNDQSADLPIELMSFTAVRHAAINVDLDWATASELNNKGFEVERMLDSETEFRQVAFVEGAGTTSDGHYYHLLDDNAHSGISYYRLKQVDFDGSFSYSDVRVVEGIAAASDIKLMPNPTNDVLSVRFGQFNAQTTHIRIFGIDGKLLYQQNFDLTTGQLLSLPITRDFPAGSYLLQAVFDNGDTVTKKFVKVIP
jgi:hypothetical protein